MDVHVLCRPYFIPSHSFYPLLSSTQQSVKYCCVFTFTADATIPRRKLAFARRSRRLGQSSLACQTKTGCVIMAGLECGVFITLSYSISQSLALDTISSGRNAPYIG
jgi:hypothetical protein